MDEKDGAFLGAHAQKSYTQAQGGMADDRIAATVRMRAHCRSSCACTSLSLSRVYLCLSHIHTLTLTHSHAPPVLLWVYTTYLIVQAAADGVCARHRWYSVSSAPIPTIVSTHAALYIRHTYVVTQVHTIARLTLALCKQVSKCAYIRLHACVCVCVCVCVCA
jgi:hypothetical protein